MAEAEIGSDTDAGAARSEARWAEGKAAIEKMQLERWAENDAQNAALDEEEEADAKRLAEDWAQVEFGEDG